MMSISQQEIPVNKVLLINDKTELPAADHSDEDFFYLAPVGFLILDKEGVIKKINAQASLLLHSPVEHLLNEKLDNVINPIDLSTYHFFIRNFAHKQSNGAGLEIRLKKRDNKITCLECRATISASDNLLLTLSDITERRQAEEAIIYHNETLSEKIRNQLLEREAKLNAIFNASIEGIVTIDSKGSIVSVNSAIAVTTA
jgi:PAS domain-containing protein